jgi:hypothetical protein
MSHFTVMVIGPNIDHQLAPFQENNMGDCPAEFMEFTDMEDEYREEYENEGREMVVMPDGTFKNPWDEAFRKPGEGSFGIGSGTHEVPAHLEQRKVMFKELHATFDDFVRDYHGCESRDEKEGRYGYWENPNRKWDWYQVGGRWSGFLKLKEGAKGAHGERSWMNRGAEVDQNYCDSATKGAIDFEGMRQDDAEKAAKRWDAAHAIINGRTFQTWEQTKARFTTDGKTDYEKAREIYGAQSVVEDFRKATFGADSLFGWSESPSDFVMSREEFIADARATAINTFAVLKDGEWYEKGEMGWWGMSNDNMTDKEWAIKIGELLDGLSDETPITIVDCHI